MASKTAAKAKRPPVNDGGKGKSSEPVEQLKKLYQFMTENDLERLEFGKEDFQVRLVRRSTNPAPAIVVTAGQPQASAAAGRPAAAAPGKPQLPPGATYMKSPMMGIFYRAASPSSPPFVKEGDTFKAGQVLCLVEAMKVFNEVKAEYDGKVHQILLENGKPVQSGQEILVVERK